MNKEPVVIPSAIGVFIQAVMNMLVVFGVNIDAVQVAAINTVFAAGWGCLAFFMRSKVTPV